GTVMRLTHLVVDAGVKKNPFRGGGLARINVRADTDITVEIKWCCTSHGKLLSRLEAVVREGFVGFSHTVHVFTLLDRRTFAFRGIDQLTGQAQGHRFFAALPSSINQPAHRQSVTTG